MTATGLSDARFSLGRAERLSTRAAFFIAGFGMAAWAPLIPYAQQRLGLDEQMLGLLLLCLGAGSIGTMALSGGLAGRYGCRLPILAAGLLICLALPGLALADAIPTLVLAVVVFGAGLGLIDVVMNLQGVLVEKAAGRPMMSGFHAMFSIGAMGGAGLVSGLLWTGASPLFATIVVAMLILGLLGATGKHLLPYGTDEVSAPFFVRPRGPVIAIGLMCFIVFLVEGAVLDWSAVFLTSERAVEAAHSGLGYAAFAVAMAVSRLCGDRLVQNVGPWLILALGGICAAAGLAIVAALPWWTAALAGFALVGVGAANLEPVMYSAVGRQTAMPRNAAISAVTMLGYSGLLAGPALIGFVAHATSLSVAFLCLSFACLVVSAAGRAVLR